MGGLRNPVLGKGLRGEGQSRLPRSAEKARQGLVGRSQNFAPGGRPAPRKLHSPERTELHPRPQAPPPTRPAIRLQGCSVPSCNRLIKGDVAWTPQT